MLQVGLLVLFHLPRQVLFHFPGGWQVSELALAVVAEALAGYR